MKNINEIENWKIAFNKWKKANVTLRGEKEFGEENGAGAMLGQGLYTAPLSNKALAKQYGDVRYVVNGKPKRPLIFRDLNEWEIWEQTLIYKILGYKRRIDFNENTNLETEIKKLGYDGVVIKGREMVNYNPENVMFYRGDNQLIDYYEHVIENRDDLNEMRKFVRKILSENFIREDYPTSFNMEVFKSLKTFKERIKYCESNLKKIGSGSSRIVYQIDDEKVLKLAKNSKGIAQNEVEIDYSHYNDINYIFAKVFDYEKNNLWLEMELARKVTKGEFKRITGFNFDDFSAAVYNYGNTVHNTRSSNMNVNVDKEVVDQMWEDEFVYSIFNFIVNYQIPVGDLRRLSSYGIVNRDGKDSLVLVDFGLNEQVYSDLYRENNEIVQESNDSNLWVNGGILLIKGKPFPDNTQPLYAVHIVDLKELPRKKVDNTDGKSAKMAILDSNLFRIIIDKGMLKTVKVDFKTLGSLSKTMNFNGRQIHAVVLNNNKTPLWWLSLQTNNFSTLFQKYINDILKIPNIKYNL